jgi:hypothetical protein
MLCPELVGEEIVEHKCMSTPTKWNPTDIRVVSEFHGLGGIAMDILRRCHDSDGKEGSTWYLPSGRKYSKDERRPAISSTKIHRIFDKTSEYQQSHTIKRMALKSDKLISIAEKHSRDLTVEVSTSFTVFKGLRLKFQEETLKVRKLETNWDHGDW